ncbi:opacity protein-like surface antigen [Bartonella japonica]|uniref:Opacity protein-like surface antigen n=1 Tax=Bartonella japonica TaxID=357761 RepID=A0ABV2FPB7_9HYPH
MNTKRLITASIFALISASAAHAADVMVPHKPMPEASSAFVAPAFTWTGFYFGAQAGSFSSKTDMNIIGEQKTIPLSKDLSPNLSGVEGGFYAGSNIDLGDNFVFGIDTDLMWSGKKHTKTITIGASETSAVDSAVVRSRRSAAVTPSTGTQKDTTLLNGSAAKPAATKPAPAKPAPAKPADTNPAPVQTAAAKPAPAQPVLEKPASEKPAASAPAKSEATNTSASRNSGTTSARMPLTLARSASSEESDSSKSASSVGNGAVQGNPSGSSSGAQSPHSHHVHHGSGQNAGHPAGHGVGAHPHAASNPHGGSARPHGALGMPERGASSAQAANKDGTSVYGIEEMKKVASEFGLEQEDEVETLSHTLKQNWAGATRVRIGFVADRFMPYVAGGIAYTQLQDTVSLSFKNESGREISSKNLTDETKTMIGYTLGGGIDFAMLDNLIVRAEYRYSDFGKKKFAKEKLEISYKTNDFRVGVAYKF